MPKATKPTSTTKIGLIFECGPQGADKQVCEYLIKRLWNTVELASATHTNKRHMIAECGKAASLLLKEGCSKILIIWDLIPPWSESKACLHEDRESIFAALKQANIPKQKVVLVCIHQELEAWLLADERAVSDLLSTPQHSVKVGRVKYAERAPNPKKTLSRIFNEHKHIKYDDLTHAVRIAQRIPDWSRLRTCDTFVRFVTKGLDRKL